MWLAGLERADLKGTDLKDLGGLLEEGHSGLVVVAASDLGERVEHVAEFETAGSRLLGGEV